ncbi:uncharacterized protein LOC126769528 [Nymphalis io]|uniref:uncharacterized protein LOC126769528 n=1 Tax=Inachis io TaxID=171585 RepID=UPI00216A641D|nr:uncharacterized protein LOC126769528 [Nymphalis io]
MFCEIPEFGRCCCCMPLRKGILVFGYLNILFSAFMVGLYSYSVHNGSGIVLVYHGVPADLDGELCIAIFCVDIIFNIALVYGAHKKIMTYLRIFYYYTIATVVAVVILEIISTINSNRFEALELMTLFVTGLCIHLYLLFLVRSLLKKMDMSGHTYENQLHQFINGELKVDTNGIYPSTVVPIENV